MQVPSPQVAEGVGTVQDEAGAWRREVFCGKVMHGPTSTFPNASRKLCRAQAEATGTKTGSEPLTCRHD